MSLFFVDNSCDLDFEQIHKLGIECFSIPYLINNTEHSFDDNFDYEKFFSKIRKGVVLTSKKSSVDDYVRVFEPALQNGDDIIYVHASGELYDFSELNKARKVLLEKYGERKIELVDSKNFSSGLGAVALELALKYKSGNSVDELVDISFDVRDKVATYLVVSSIEQLTLNGILSDNVSVGSALNVNYIISIDLNGRLNIVEKINGRKRAINKLCQIVRQQGQNVSDYTVIITEAGTGKDGAELMLKLKEAYGEDLRVVVQKMSPITTAMVGLGALSIAFHVHRKLS